MPLAKRAVRSGQPQPVGSFTLPASQIEFVKGKSSLAKAACCFSRIDPGQITGGTTYEKSEPDQDLVPASLWLVEP